MEDPVRMNYIFPLYGGAKNPLPKIKKIKEDETLKILKDIFGVQLKLKKFKLNKIH